MSKVINWFVEAIKFLVLISLLIGMVGGSGFYLYENWGHLYIDEHFSPSEAFCLAMLFSFMMLWRFLKLHNHEVEKLNEALLLKDERIMELRMELWDAKESTRPREWWED